MLSGLNLRQKPHISDCETKEPNLDKYVLCDECSDFVYEYCSIHGTLLVIPDTEVPPGSSLPAYVLRAALTIPRVFLHLAPSTIPGAGVGVFSTLTLPRGVRFGPYRGTRTNDRNCGYAWQIHDGNNKRSHLIDASDANASNWMRYVNCARHWCEQNLLAYQCQGQIYYRTIKIIPRFTELMVFYGSEFADLLGIELKHYNSPTRILRETCVPEIFCNYTKADDRSQEIHTIEEKIVKAKYDEINHNNICSISKKPHDITEKNNKANTRNLQINAKVVNSYDMDSPNFITENLNIHNIGNNSIDQIDRFICDTCGRDFVRKEVLTSHIEDHTSKNNHNILGNVNRNSKSDNLLTKSTTLGNLQITKNKDSLPKLFECTYCDYKNLHEDDFKRHISIHTGGMPHKCTYCNYSSLTESRLKRHIRTHTEERPDKCKYCNFSCADKVNLSRHVRTHTGERAYKCTFCNYTYMTNSHLKRHIRTHTGERPYKCTFCNNSFITNTDLKRHIRIHTGERPHQCTFCNNSFITNRDLKRHIRTHTGERPYKCRYCNYSYITNCNLKRHIRTHTGERPHQCTFCNNSFITNSDLKRHIRTHTGERPYKCTYCNYTYITNRDLKRHIRTHTGERPYKCTFCNNSFITNSDLKRHIWTHKGERPYKCSYCNHSCNRKYSLKRHERTHTGERLQCAHCSLHFNRKLNLIIHLKKHKYTNF